jgi:hypothetical protein
VTDKRKESSRKGGLLGGRLRAANLSAARKREIAVNANRARWGKSVDVLPTQSDKR